MSRRESMYKLEDHIDFIASNLHIAQAKRQLALIRLHRRFQTCPCSTPPHLVWQPIIIVYEHTQYNLSRKKCSDQTAPNM